jgi:phage terminase large subunit-like protein
VSLDAVDIGGLKPKLLCELFACTLVELLGAFARLADFERFASKVPTVQGPPYAIDPFQRLILFAYFLGFTEVLTLIPKGNGKTSLLALLQVYHLLTTPYPEVVAGASVRAQAGKIYREASRIAGLPELRNGGVPTPWRVPGADGGYREVWLRPLPGYLEIRLGRRPEDGNMLVLASDKYDTGSLEGLGPTLGVAEELHAHRTDAIYAAIQGGLHKRDGQLFGISTAGKRLDSLLGDIRGNTLKRGVITRVPEFGFLTVARIDRDFIMFEWAVPEDADLDDMDVVKGANPATFVTPENLRGLRASPGMTDARWKRNHCGLWTSEDEGWLEGREAWDANRRPTRLQDGDEIVLGIDPAWSYDSFAIVGLKVTGHRQAFCEPIEILRPRKGKTVSHRQIRAALARALKRFRVTDLGYDRNRGFAHIVEELSLEHGLNCIAVSMRGDVWVPLTAELRAAIDDGSWTHPADDVYTSHVLSGEIKATHAGERLHGNTSEKVDALMATGIAWHTAFGAAEDDEIYRDRDLVTSADDEDELDDFDDDDLDGADDEFDDYDPEDEDDEEDDL